jgi:hypothetical protein
MRVKIIVEPADHQPGGVSHLQVFMDADESQIPNVGDTVQLEMMNAPELVKARHFKYLDSNTVEVRLEY